MAAATVVTTVGSGAFLVVAVLYFTRIVELTPGQVGIGMSIAGSPGWCRVSRWAIWATATAPESC
jgi:hypothetical protein